VNGFVRLWFLREAKSNTLANKMKILSLFFKWCAQKDELASVWTKITALKIFVDDVRQEQRKKYMSELNTSKRDKDLQKVGQWLNVSILLLH
jgi:hypothetical protein